MEEKSSVDEVLSQLGEAHSADDRLLLDRLLLDDDRETLSPGDTDLYDRALTLAVKRDEDEMDFDGWNTEDLDIDVYERLFASWNQL